MAERLAGQNLTQSIVERLGQAIVSGKYSDATRFPTEAEICEIYGASRSSVREAVKMLTARGLLSARPRQGTRVEPEENWAIFDGDVARWLLSTRSSFAIIREVVQLRRAVEPDAAASAAHHQDKAAIELIRAAFGRMKDAAAGRDDPIASEIEFHTAICRASDNRFLRRFAIFASILLDYQVPLTNRWSGVSSGDVDAHGKILAAIEAGDAELARSLSRELLKGVIDQIDRMEAEAGETREAVAT